MSIPPTRTSAAIYLDRRIVSIFILGILSGLPWVMIGSALTLWLKEAGISRTDIGYAGLITFVYAVNCFWSPLLDTVTPKNPFKMGSRRSWILWCQMVIALACLVISQLSAELMPTAVVLTGFIIALCSATQDIAIDAYRVDQFAPHQSREISAAASASTAGWWTGYAGLGFVPLWLSDLGWSWPQLYLVMAALSLSFASVLFFSGDPPAGDKQDVHDRVTASRNLLQHAPKSARLQLLGWLVAPFVLVIWAISGSIGLPSAIHQSPFYVPILVALEIGLLINLLHQLSYIKRRAGTTHYGDQWTTLTAWLLATVLAPFEEFFKRNGLKLALSLLLFIVVFKLGESFLGRMSILFYKEVGFTNTEIASYSKILTWIVTVAAAVPCGLLNARLGLTKGLFISGLFMAASNLMFIILANVGPDTTWYLATIIVDGVTAAWASIAFVSFISMLCSHTFSATQYALLASLGALGRTTLAAFSGQLVDGLDGDWTIFFIITTVMVVPGLILLLRIGKQVQNIQIQAVQDAQKRENG